jgi:hypothetical protein
MMADPPDSPDHFDRTEPGGRPSLASSSAAPSETQQTSAPLASKSTPPPPQVSQSPSRASVPPSEPRSASRASFSQIDLSADRPARLQMIVALLLGLVLVAIPLYLWRRPRAESIAATGSADAGTDPNAAAAAPATAPADDAKLTLGEPKSVLCQDPGPKKTSPEQCDHVVEVEKAFAKAIEESASCVPKDAGGGTIQYVADVSFKKKALNVAVPKDGRTMKNAKVVSACHAAVKSKLQALSLDPIAHTHARYKIAITASYPGTVK